MTRKALLLGATGLVGNDCLTNLLESDEYEQVRVLCRRPLSVEHPKLDVQVIDLDDMEAYQSHFQVDDVFCCLGTTMKKAGSRQAFRHVDHDLVVLAGQMALRAGVQRFLVVSAINANARSPFFYSRVKGQAERALIKLELPLLAILQPSLLRGQREDRRPAEDWGNIFNRVIEPLTRWTDAHWLPVDSHKVADAMVGMALEGPQTGLYKLRYRDFLVFAGKFRNQREVKGE
ncbi:NAD(P)H-binding protein [Alcanivorax sp.]|uniref:NAD(P)H-binding protein n=1 Tax=Alcanivorax sp. TaxID=1872427 RepID=UPI0025C680C0|nr:NAD(P)H-binding protein [Alcanivorax sp.]